MKVKYVIKKLEQLKAKYGDVECNIYLSFSKVTRPTTDIFYNDEEEDICLRVYG